MYWNHGFLELLFQMDKKNIYFSYYHFKPSSVKVISSLFIFINKMIVVFDLSLEKCLELVWLLLEIEIKLYYLVLVLLYISPKIYIVPK